MIIRTMKAVVLQSNQQMELMDIPNPELTFGECRLKIRAAGVCSSDIFRACESGAYFYPLVMGHEIAGEVVEISREGQPRFQVGDRVAVFPLIPCNKCIPCTKKDYAQCINYDYYGSRRNGGFAEFLNVRSWNLLKIPDAVSFENAALLEPISVVLHCLKRSQLLDTKINREARVSILGAGFLGLVATQILLDRRPDLNLTLVDRNQFKLDFLHSSAVKKVLLKNEKEWDQYVQENASNADIIIEATGDPQAYRNSLRLASHGGSAVWMGNITGDLEIPKKEVSAILRKELRIVGTWNSFYHPTESNDWTDAINLLKQGLEVSQLVTRIALSELPDTLLNMYSHKKRIDQNQLLKAMIVNF